PVHERFQLALPLQVEPVHHVLGDDHEKGQVDGVNAFTKDGPLPTTLSYLRSVFGGGFAQKGAGVLKIVAGDDPAQSLARLQWLAVSRVHVPHLALRHRHERYFMDAILPAPKPKVKTTAEQVRMVTGFIAQCNDAPFLYGTFSRPQLLHDTDPAIRNVAQTDQ